MRIYQSPKWRIDLYNRESEGPRVHMFGHSILGAANAGYMLWAGSSTHKASLTAQGNRERTGLLIAGCCSTL